MAKNKRKSPPPKAAPLENDQKDLEEIAQFLEEMEGAGQPQAEGGEEPREAPEQDLQARWIAEGLGRPPAELSRVVAGSEAGEEGGQVFYGVPLEGGELLIRADGLSAWVRNLSLEKAGDNQTRRALEELGLIEIKAEGQGPWIRVAQGRAPRPGRAGQIEFYCPNQPGERLSYQILTLLSAEVQQVFQEGDFDPQSLPGVQAVAVVPGQVVARVSGREAGQEGQDVFGRTLPPPLESPQGQVEAGWKVAFSEEGEYRAEGCGYLCLAEGRLSVLPPLWVEPGGMRAGWVLLDPHAQPLSTELVQQCLGEAGVVSGIQPERVAELAELVRSGRHPRGFFLLAQGALPVDGEDAQVQILVDLQRRAGKEMPDGSIDFREVNFAPSVGVGQVIARRRPHTEGAVGHDVKGEVLEARQGEPQPLKAGAHVELRFEEGVEVYAASIEGVVRKVGEELRVIRQLAVKGDVDFGTGNLDFRGDVYIDGSVVQGFSVKATGTITITNTVENGSTLLAVEDVVVGRGILGRRTRVQAGGKVRAQFIQEARVEAGGDIAVGNYVYHALLRAEGKVLVYKGTGSRGGVILGGEVWGREGVEVFQLGSTNGVAGMVVAGLQPGQAQQLDKLKASASLCQEHVQKLLRKFNLSRIDLGQIRNMVAAATGPHRKVLVHHAQQLGQLVQLYQKLQGEQAALESRIRTSVKGAAIRVHDTACWGVTVRIGEYQRRLREDVKGARFRIFEGRLVER